MRMRRNSFTPRASADAARRPRHHSLGSKPLHLLGPLPALQAREGAEQPQLEVSVQVVPSLCSPSPPSLGPAPAPRALFAPAWESPSLDWIKGEKTIRKVPQNQPQSIKILPIQLEFWWQALRARFPSWVFGRGVNPGFCFWKSSSSPLCPSFYCSQVMALPSLTSCSDTNLPWAGMTFWGCFTPPLLCFAAFPVSVSFKMHYEPCCASLFPLQPPEGNACP